MPIVKKSIIIPYKVEQMYDLINDIEAYPEFLPWCKATQVHERSATELKATIYIEKGPLSQSITTVNKMEPYSLIQMQYVAGPFKYCEGAWHFMPTAQEETVVTFTMDYQFSNRLIALAAEPVFNPIANTLIDAFKQRAAQIYGN